MHVWKSCPPRTSGNDAKEVKMGMMVKTATACILNFIPVVPN